MNNRIKYLDGIRIISSVVVCIAHSIQIFLIPKLGSTNILSLISGQAASYAVVVFFMLSGFMVTNSIFNNNSKNNYFSFSKYWKDRLLRLYPPLIFSIGLSLFIYLFIKFFHLHGSVSFKLPEDLGLARDAIQYSFGEMVNSLFFIQGFKNISMLMNGPLWSLGDEFFLYLIASLVSIMVFNRKVILPALLIIFLFIYVYQSGHLKTAIYLYVMWGIGAFFSIEKNKPIDYFTNRINFIFCITFFLLLFGILLLLKFRIPPINYEFSKSTLIQASVLLFFVFLFRSLSISLKNEIIKLFEKITPAKDFTYTLYVIHFPILLFYFSLTHVWLNSMYTYSSYIVLLVIIPTIIYIANRLAKYLENKKYVENVCKFLLSH